jgi:hypothetical protein
MIKSIPYRWVAVAVVLGTVLSAGPASAQTSVTGAFIYQGQLQSSGAPYSGSADLRFTLWADSTGASQVGVISLVSNISITNGSFTAIVNATGEFGSSPFNGSQRWLKIAVRTPHDPTNTQPFTPLNPRQPLTGAPYALGLGFPFLGTGSTPNTALFLVQNSGAGQAISGQSAQGHGVYGRNGAGSGLQPLFGYGTGVWGDTDNGNGLAGTSATGFGVYGALSSASGINPPTGAGVVGDCHDNSGVMGLSSAGTGVYGLSSTLTGVYGSAHGPSTIGTNLVAGVHGDSDIFDGVIGSTNGNAGGVVGEATSTSGTGVVGLATATSGPCVGVWGATGSPAGWAGYFQGNVNVTGTLSKGAGAFKIDHPLDPQNRYLYHSFVESPDMMNLYNGIVTTDQRGYATVHLPDWFEALNRDYRYELTVVDSTDSDTFVQAKVVRGVANNQFTLRTSLPATRVSWLVTGIRHDAFANAHRIPVEEEKPLAERGLYLYPKELGQPEEQGLAWQMENRNRREAERPPEPAPSGTSRQPASKQENHPAVAVQGAR